MNSVAAAYRNWSTSMWRGDFAVGQRSVFPPGVPVSSLMGSFATGQKRHTGKVT